MVTKYSATAQGRHDSFDSDESGHSPHAAHHRLSAMADNPSSSYGTESPVLSDTRP